MPGGPSGVDATGAALDALAGRDQSAPMAGEHRGDFARISGSLNTTAESLQETVAQVASSAQVIAVARTSSRLEKVARLADVLRRLAPGEASVAVPWLAGGARQGRTGVAGVLLRGVLAASSPANEPTLHVTDVDEALTRVAAARGAGSQGERRRLLADLLARATEAERDFLARLLFGELRQGALEGVLLDAVARASGAPPSELRRAAMMAGALAPVAAAALAEGPGALGRFRMRLLGGLVMLGKTFKGMTDAMLAWQTERLAALAVADDGFTVQVRPELVVEVAFDGIQASPRYPGGIALRFARVKRFREDKRPEDADTIEAVRALHRRGAVAGDG